MFAPLLALLLVSCAGPKDRAVDAAAAPGAADRLGVEIHTLSNGMRVYLSPNREEPRIAARIVIRAGSAEDPRDATGMAHYLEHLLANKGTRRLGTTDPEAEREHLDRVRTLYDTLFTTTAPEARAELYGQIAEASSAASAYAVPNELKQLWGLLGGRGFNARTSLDWTDYVVDLPANRLVHWAHVEADRFSEPVFRGFQTEVETVYEEKNRALDNPERAVSDALLAAVHAGLPYEITTLGTVDHLKNPSMSEAEAFFERWYAPGNMAVVLAGDLEPTTTLALLEATLGRIPPREVPERATGELLPLEGERRVEVVHRGDPSVTIAWRGVPEGHPDVAAVRLATALLYNGSTGLLDQHLRLPQIVRSASASAPSYRLAGTWSVSGVPRAGQSLDELRALLLAQVERLRQGEFEEADLEAAVRQARRAEKLQLESNQSRVQMMARAFAYDLPWEDVRDWSDRLARVTREDVVRVARTYLGDDRVVVAKTTGTPTIPKLEAPRIPPLTLRTDAHSELFREILALPAPELPVQELVEGRDYHRVEAPSGPVYVTPNPYSDLFALTFRWEAGSSTDPALCLAFSLWGRTGVGESDLQEWATWAYRRGVTVRTSCNRTTSELSIAGEADVLDEALERVAARIARPSLQGGELARLVEDVIESRANHKTRREAAAAALTSYAREGSRSAYLEPLPDEALRALEPEALLARIKALWDAERVTIYAGTLPLSDVLARVGRADGEITPVPPRARRRLVEPERPRVLVLHHEAAQADVAFELPHELRDPEREPEYWLLTQLLGGSAGLVFQEVREARGYAYSASAGYGAGDELGDQGSLWGRVGCQADKAADVAALLVTLLRPPSTEDRARWERARASAMEALVTSRVGFRSIGGQVEAWRRAGSESDPRPALREALATRPVEDLSAFVAAFAEKPFTLSITGDLTRIDRAALEAIAPVEELHLDDLTSY